MNPLENLRSDALRGKWSEVLKTYEKESALRMENITATGDTALHMAVSSGKEKVVEKMVDLLVDEEKKRTQDGDGEVSRNVTVVLGAENEKKNTPLHLAAKRGNVKMCKKIGEIDHSLITRRNIMGETPLFLAALYGSKEAFLWLHYLHVKDQGVSSADLAHCKRDNDDTILHCAIGEGHFDVAIEIVHLYKDHMEEMMKRNKEGLSPLHLLASERSAFKIASLLEVPILLHSVYWLWIVKEKNHATTTEDLLQKGLWIVKEKNLATTTEDLLQKENEENFLFSLFMGICYLPFLSISFLVLLLELLVLLLELLLLPLLLFTFSKAVFQRWLHDIPKMKKKHTWGRQIMTKLLQHASGEDMSQIISSNASEQLSMSLQTKEDNEWKSTATPTSGTITIETPLMISVKNGAVEMVEKIIELFPSRIKDLNADGKNILLLAIEDRQVEVFKFLCKHEWLTESLFEQVDKDGNNALHLAAGLKPGEAISLGNLINWFKVVKASVPRDLLGRYNRKMETPGDIFKESHKELKKSEGEWVAKTSEACSVVSTLVVSVAFATRTSVPGGYEGDNGYAILRNKPQAFKTFREFSFVALFSSLISTICFLSIVASSPQSAHFLGYVPSRFYCGVYFMFGSIVCLWISFCAADFFMLHDDAQKLHKALPNYIWLTCGVILMVVLQLPIFLGPKLSALLGIPAPRRKGTRPIEYRRTKNKENGTDLNHQN